MSKTIQVLKDANGHPLGKIVESNGKLDLLDAANDRVGTYDPKTDRTTLRGGKPVGKGNLLTTLLVKRTHT